ncbi:MAG: SIMPL domain-containing protein [Patescibacteria group bacterium]
MNNNTRNYLGWAGVLALLVLAYGIVSYTSTYSRSITPSTFRSFAVNGEGRYVAKPDIARFTFTVRTEGGKNIAALRDDNSKRTNRAIDGLKQIGVDADDIKTENYSLEPRYQSFVCSSARVLPNGASTAQACPPAEIVGYTISQMIGVKVRENLFDKIGDIITGVTTAGANVVSQLTFDIDDRTEAENQARQAAIEDAKKKAEAVAEAGDFEVGRLLSIDEGGFFPVYSKFGMGGDAESFAAPAAAPRIEPGTQDIIVNITLRYEID